MSRHSGRDDKRERPQLLAALGACRNALTSELATMKPMGPLYQFCSGVIAAIDALAHYMTGQPYYFHDKGSVGSGRPNSER
jgi:hypothetical protein